ncbi:MAG TPA: nucleotidyltransferase family protein [Candidatus Limnocylindrales bacterium]|nr:nucleotidyltransferase family protein [Candidatus Limnocylindrales bacterium]
MDRGSAGPPLPLRTAGVILAAGAGSRFGGDKLVATVGGRPLVRHVVDAAVEAGLEPIVVVVPPGGAVGSLDLAPATRVVNPNPGEGLSSSVRIGLRMIDADAESADPVAAAVILPADQPFVRAATIRALVDAAVASPAKRFVVARHAADRTPNPVLARRDGWRLADELAGDRGFGPLLADHPELVEEVLVAGSNPDVDTPDDLRRAAAERGPISPGKP